MNSQTSTKQTKTRRNKKAAESAENISAMTKLKHIHRGYYTVARRYEFYVRVATTISHE